MSEEITGAVLNVIQNFQRLAAIKRFDASCCLPPGKSQRMSA